MDNLIIQAIKMIAMLVLATIVIGMIGALALSYGALIAGAVCFLIAGIVLGVLLGIFLSGLYVEEG